jgi:hypothetical protein
LDVLRDAKRRSPEREAFILSLRFGDGPLLVDRRSLSPGLGRSRGSRRQRPALGAQASSLLLAATLGPQASSLLPLKPRRLSRTRLPIPEEIFKEGTPLLVHRHGVLLKAVQKVADVAGIGAKLVGYYLVDV